MASDFRVVLVAVPDEELANKLAKELVLGKLAACVNIVPQVTSYYRWEGKLEKSAELLLVIKTRSGLIPNLIRFVKENHSDKTPEIISLPIMEGEKQYLNWIGANTLFVKPKGDDSLPL